MRNLEVLAQPQVIDRPPIEGFTAWWDAADQATFQGGIGSTVATWRDKGSARRDLTQASDALRPYSGSWSQNGRNVLWCFGKGSYLMSTAGAVAGSGYPHTLFLAAADCSGDGVQRTTYTHRVNTGDNRIYRTNTDLIAHWSNGGFTTTQTWQRNRPRVITLISRNTTAQVNVDGRYTMSGSSGGWPSDGMTVMGFGGSESWLGWIGEVILYPSELTPSAIQQVESYLMRKWGLS